MSILQITYKLNNSVDSILNVTCLSCERVTKHKVVSSVEERAQNASLVYHYWQVENHQIIQCLGCETISFRTASCNSEDTDYDDEENIVIPYLSEALYPSRSAGRVVLKDVFLLPLNIQRIYTETVNAINNSLPVLTGIGIRSVVETVCKDKNACGKDLYEKINALIKLGFLTADGAKTLHQIRTLGNEAAHEVKPHKSEQLSLALDVCEHLLKGVYLLPHYAQQTFK